MRLLLYNIRYGAGIGRQFHFPIPYSGYLKPTNGNFSRILDFIRSAEPDIVGLVEVDCGSYRVEKRSQADALAAELNHRVVVRSKYAETSLAGRTPLLNKQGNALLTNQQIISERFHYLTNGVKRLVIEVELPQFHVFLVHLSLKYRYRQYQLRELYSLIQKCRKPVIVAGDFNALWGGDRELELFMAATGLVSANRGGLFSYPSRMPLMELDYIFHSPQMQTTGFEMPAVRFSDHVPLIWDFALAA
ncbi:MAG: endonuclease/exonuclease/phosphatase family protein [Desulfobacterales bacterium]|jgi:endonuclease/exonuclease/phosphatase family metal-dependent hydrolase